MQVEITISYNQLCVFDPELENPYNDWNAAQTEQGFSWRHGSVSFATEGNSAVIIEIQHVRDEPNIENAATAICVPFDVPASGIVEVGSILSSGEVSLPPGQYALYFIQPSNTDDTFILSFVPAQNVEPRVLQGSVTAKAQLQYDMNASPA